MNNRRMPMHRPSGGPVRPLYQQVANGLAAQIRRGEYRPGSLLPSERQLCDAYGVSAITARRALLELTRQGLVYRQQGLGSFVADPQRGARITLVFTGFAAQSWRDSAGGMAELIGGISEVAWQQNCALQIVRTDDRLDNELLARLIEEGGCDGLLLRPVDNIRLEQVQFLDQAAFPYVYIRRYMRDRRVSCVIPADEVGVKLAVAHLARLGHRRIGFISALPDMVLTGDRVRGFWSAVQAHGLADEPALLHLAESYGPASGYRGAFQLLRQRPGPSAVIVDADMASGLYQAAADLGRDIPGDLAVVGYDETPEARALVPRLTCIRTPHHETGRMAAELLLAIRFGPGGGPQERIIEPGLEVRASCGAAAGHGEAREAADRHVCGNG